jgi:hypothetical protein
VAQEPLFQVSLEIDTGKIGKKKQSTKGRINSEIFS